MKIGVCFKAIPDVGMLGPDDWEIQEDLTLDLGFIRRVLNGCEESGLELALGLFDRLRSADQNPALTALTVDGSTADLFLRQLAALGYGRTLRIQPDPAMDLRFNPMVLSRILTAATRRKGDIQVLIFGEQGGEGNNGQTGFFTAENLGWPCIRSVTDIFPGSCAGTLTIHSTLDTRTLVQTVSLPLVLIVGNTRAAPFLRVPTLPQKLMAAKKKIEVLTLKDLDINPLPVTGQGPRLTALTRPESGRTCEMIGGETCREKAIRVYKQFLKQRLGP